MLEIKEERETAHEVRWTSALRGPKRSVEDRTLRHGSVLEIKEERETAHEVRWTSALRGPKRSVEDRTLRHGCVSKQKKRYPTDISFFVSRARDGDRTRDPLLGKEVLHR